jgi:hypothetical protein
MEESSLKGWGRSRCGPVRITTHDGDTVLELPPQGRITFGRDPTLDLAFTDDLRLSRRAG